MGLLDGGIARLFGNVLGAIYLDGLLHIPVRTETEGGSVGVAFTGDDGQPEATACKAQRDDLSAADREALGYAPTDERFMILTRAGAIELPELQQGMHLTWPTPGGTRYSIETPLRLDAATSHWTVRCRPVP